MNKNRNDYIKKNNDRVLARMKNPQDTLMTCEVDQIWFQPRPVDHEKIKKMKKNKDILKNEVDNKD
jgi:hypothetical protein